ncbi:MAG: redoxin domain-containing protein [Acidimicrobiia bacterium]|nr:redoxin domain-containing protein [Acidimicrobiia bacterium]
MLALVGAALVVLLVVFVSRFGLDPSLVASPLIGTNATDQPIEFMEKEGSMSLTDYRGDLVVVNFWASWCLSCRLEHDALIRGADVYTGVRFVGVNYQDTPENAASFLDTLGRSDAFNYVVDSESRIALDFGVLGLPETFFIDREGVIVAKVNGPLNYPLLAGTLDTMLVGGSVESVTTGEVQQRPGG